MRLKKQLFIISHILYNMKRRQSDKQSVFSKRVGEPMPWYKIMLIAYKKTDKMPVCFSFVLLQNSYVMELDVHVNVFWQFEAFTTNPWLLPYYKQLLLCQKKKDRRKTITQGTAKKYICHLAHLTTQIFLPSPSQHSSSSWEKIKCYQRPDYGIMLTAECFK